MYKINTNTIGPITYERNVFTLNRRKVHNSLHSQQRKPHQTFVN